MDAPVAGKSKKEGDYAMLFEVASAMPLLAG